MKRYGYLQLQRCLVIIGMVGLCLSCSKDRNSVVTLPMIQGQGSIFIHCEQEPFYLDIDEIVQGCAITLPLDSIQSQFWEPGCAMFDVQKSPEEATFRLHYLETGTPEVVVLEQGWILEPGHQVFIGGEEADIEEYPYYGAFTLRNDDLSILFIMLSRYIGGCFHDELVWQVQTD